MNYKKKILILSIFLLITLQISLLINNRQKTSFRYLIWNIQDVSIGRLICVSFITGLLMSSLLNKTLHNNIRNFPINDEDDKPTEENDYSIRSEDNKDSYEIPPERDLRETHPTISVNYRVITDNVNNEFKDSNQRTNRTQYQDDWSNDNSEW